MATNQFQDYIDQFCKLVGIQDSRKMHDAANLEVDGTKFTVTDGSKGNGFSVLVFCDFGKVPRNNQRADALQRLLEVNLCLFGINTPYFSINPETDHVLLIGRFNAQEMTPKELLRMLGQFSIQAKEWQKSYFLTSDEQAELSGKRMPPQQALLRDLKQAK